ncbi:MAG TPA: hypothetical protein VKS43_08505 [Burkholderiales bacterium]|nr:hypothetical protein [Burkholderiales bacterium]
MLALITAAVFAFLALMHFYWAAGGGSGKNAAVPEIDGVPAFKTSFKRARGSKFARMDTLLYSPLCLALGAALAVLAAS